MAEFIWQSPSNLALVKYWGKYGQQLPCNPSISFTLEAAHSQTSWVFVERQEKVSDIELEFWFEDEPQPAFREKILAWLRPLLPEKPFLGQYRLEIRSRNSFPHSAGIASSASGMSALALGLCSMARFLQPQGPLAEEAAFWREASRLARLGSGSACRSVYPGLALWGEAEGIAGSSNDYALPMQDAVHPIFKSYRNAILLVSRREKAVSSRAGHGLMNSHPYAQVRYQQAKDNLAKLMLALAEGDLDSFGDIVEEEALTLHGLMFNSRPSFMLMLPETLAVLQKVRDFRRETGLPLHFSLDAGPNPHLLYPEARAEEIEDFIQSELLPLTVDGEAWLLDRVGQGPKLMVNG